MYAAQVPEVDVTQARKHSQAANSLKTDNIVRLKPSVDKQRADLPARPSLSPDHGGPFRHADRVMIPLQVRVS